MRTKQRERSVTVAEIVDKALEFDLAEFLVIKGGRVETTPRFAEKNTGSFTFDVTGVSRIGGADFLIGTATWMSADGSECLSETIRHGAFLACVCMHLATDALGIYGPATEPARIAAFVRLNDLLSIPL